MAKVEIYTTPLCPYCVRAKRLLKSKGVTFDEIDLWAQPGRRPEMLKRTEGRTSVPQILVDGSCLGGCDDIHALEARGELDLVLGAGASSE